MLRDLSNLNNGVSRNQRKILLDMDNIGGGAQRKRMMGNFMACK